MHLADAVVAEDRLKDAGLALLNQAISAPTIGSSTCRKTGKLTMGMVEQMMCFTTAKGFIAGKAGKHYPAPVQAVKSMERAAGMTRDDALKIEAKGFIKMQTTVADSLIGLF